MSDWLELARISQYKASSLAKLLGVSLRQLERCFWDSCRETPQNWLDQVRLWEAARRLLEGQPAKFVSSELCFKNLPHFYNKFKMIHHCTPREFLFATLRRQSIEPAAFGGSEEVIFSGRMESAAMPDEILGSLSNLPKRSNRLALRAFQSTLPLRASAKVGI